MQIKHTHLPTPEQNTLSFEVSDITVADIVDCWFHATCSGEEALKRVDRKIYRGIFPTPIGAKVDRIGLWMEVWFKKDQWNPSLGFTTPAMIVQRAVTIAFREVWRSQGTSQRAALLKKLEARGESVSLFADMPAGLKDGLNLHALDVPTRIEIEYGIR